MPTRLTTDRLYRRQHVGARQPLLRRPEAGLGMLESLGLRARRGVARAAIAAAASPYGLDLRDDSRATNHTTFLAACPHSLRSVHR